MGGVRHAWEDPSGWEELKKPSSCPICTSGEPRDVLAEFRATWITAGKRAALPGYACVVAKRHVIEPFELPFDEAAEFWREAMVAARVLNELFKPTKLNYEIHGNRIPHLHLHLFPRFIGDPYVGGPIDPSRASVVRTPGELDRIRRALLTADADSRE